MFGRKQKEERKELKTILEEFIQDWKQFQKAQALEGQAQALEGQAQALEGQAQALEGQAQVLEGQAQALREFGREQAACREQIERFGQDMERQLKRHSEAIEDLLEERGAQEAAIERCENQIREAEERENMLLALLCRYQEEMGLIEEKLCNVDSQHARDWSEQLALFKRSLEGELRQCAIEETGRPGELADYRYHEILDTEDTEKPELNGRVAHCYRPGCIYHGRVVMKARIRAYRSNVTLQ